MAERNRPRRVAGVAVAAFLLGAFALFLNELGVPGVRPPRRDLVRAEERIERWVGNDDPGSAHVDWLRGVVVATEGSAAETPTPDVHLDPAGVDERIEHELERRLLTEDGLDVEVEWEGDVYGEFLMVGRDAGVAASGPLSPRGALAVR